MSFQRFIAISEPILGKRRDRLTDASENSPEIHRVPLRRSRRPPLSPNEGNGLEYSIGHFSTFSGCYGWIGAGRDARPNRRRREENGRAAQAGPRGGESLRQL